MEWSTAEEFWELCYEPPRWRRFISYPGELSRVDPDTGHVETWDEWVDSLEPELATLIRDASRARTPDEIAAAKAAVEELALRDPGNSFAIIAGEMLAESRPVEPRERS